MAIYGQDLYGKSFYGVDSAISFSLEPVTAIQTGYGEITLHWVTPVNTQNWSALRLVRNTAGFPASENDGDILLSLTSTQAQNVYTDSGLTGGRYYYYAFFLASAFPAYSSTNTYQPGDTVSYGGSNWVCLAANTRSVTPVAGATWGTTNQTALWNRAGRAVSLAVADYGYRDLLYDLTPAPYSTGQQETSAPSDDVNSALYRYLSVLAWGLDMARTELGEQQHLHRVDTMPLTRLEHLAAELGVSQEASITPRLRRYRVGHAAELGRRKGTLDSLRDAIYATTGYDADFTESPNRLLDGDQAEFHYPQFPVWDPSVGYAPGQIVSYQGYLYSAVPSTIRIEAENTTITLSGAPSYITQGNRTSVTYSNNQQILVKSNAVGQSVTLTFNIPTSGTYDLAIGMTRSYDYGITEFAVDGTRILTGAVAFTLPPTPIPVTFDGYAPSPAAATSVYLGSFTLLSGNHTVEITVDNKNAQSGTNPNSQSNGYQIGVDYLTYTPNSGSSIIGISPTGNATNNAFWTYYTAVQSHALDNPLTGGISTWEQISFTAGATASNANLSLYSGYSPLNGTGDHTANLAVMTNGTGVTATLGVHSIPHAKVSAWDSTLVYPKNSYVSYNGVNYLALLPSQGSEPDADLLHWQPETISTTGTDRFLVSSYGIPLTHTPVWSSGVTYDTGAVVAYQGQRYIASTASHSIAPSGRPTDNSAWAWLDTAQETYTASAWTSVYGGSTTSTRSLWIEWYDATGTLITSISPTANTSADLLAAFSRDSANLATDPGSALELNGLTWTNSSTDTPVAYSGLAYWGTRSDSSVNGRHLTVNYGAANINVGISFVTSPPTGIEHGILFRWSSTTNFWAASRSRLTKTVSGTMTTLATWSALPDGARMYVTLQGSVITVYTYQGPGLAPVQLATVTDSALSTNTSYGIFERAY